MEAYLKFLFIDVLISLFSEKLLSFDFKAVQTRKIKDALKYNNQFGAIIYIVICKLAYFVY